MLNAIIFIFGLIVGSFLNAVIYRLHSGESILAGRSHCPYCGRTLQAYDLVPVLSFVWLRGRCRYCRKKISWQYPIIEIITALVFVLFSSQAGSIGLVLIFNLLIASSMVVIAAFDFKYYLILDKVIFPTVVLVLIRNIYLDQVIHQTIFSLHSQVTQGILSALIVSGFFLLQYLFSQGKWIGLGDVKLGLLLGLLAGWPQSLVLLMLAYFSGAAVGLILMALGKKEFSSQLAFGTFLGASAIITMLYGSAITNWYFKLIGL